MAKILILFFETAVAEKIRLGLGSRGHQSRVVPSFSELRSLRLGDADLLLFNYFPEEYDFLVFLKQQVNSPSAGGLKVLAAVPDRNMGTLEQLFRCGVGECVPRPFRLGDLLDRAEKLLSGTGGEEMVHPDSSEFNSVPRLLHERVESIKAAGRQLGDIAEIFGGVAAHDGKGRRMSAPSPDWQPVLTEKSVEAFYVNEEREYFLFNRSMVTRIPEKYEYNLKEKVVLRRVASPLTAALDTSRLPYSNGLLGMVTAKGLEPGYLVCVLNSRFANFYLQRYRTGNDEMQGVYFSRFDLEALPVIIAEPREQQALSALAQQISRIDPGTRQTEKKIERNRMLAEVNKRILEIFGFTDAEVRLLGELHY